jgi:deoxycytidine triphosphate deaminase
MTLPDAIFAGCGLIAAAIAVLDPGFAGWILASVMIWLVGRVLGVW